MHMRYSTISFLSDYGYVDEFVGIVHSVVRSIAPDVAVIDITHSIVPFDVRGGGLALARSAPFMAPGVVIAVVDPGVGTSRRAVAIEVGDGASVLVGPDNGLLAPAVALCGGATAAVVLDNPEYHLADAATTFDGRDVFAPVAAHLCLGVPLAELGTPIDPNLLTPGMMPVARYEGDSLVTEVLWVDRYGNVQLNVDEDDIAPLGAKLRVRAGTYSRTAARARTFADIPTGGLGVVVDSYGLIALCVDRASAADDLRLAAGDEVVLEPLADDAATGMATAVRLTAKGPRS